MNYLTTIISLILFLGSCTSYDQYQKITEEYEIPSQYYDADFRLTWSALISVMKKYDIEEQNMESGALKTGWIDNTTELNFTDSFGGTDKVKAAKFKLTINVVKGKRSGRDICKVSIIKKQMVEQDFLQGWKQVDRDSILEKTLLYRIYQVIEIEKNILAKQLETEKKAINNFQNSSN